MGAARFGGVDYTRVCSKCGHARLLPKKLAKALPPAFGVMALDRLGVDLAVKSKKKTAASTRYAARQGQRDTYLANAQCPRCGSSEFKQFKGSDVYDKAQLAEQGEPPPPTTAEEPSRLDRLAQLGRLRESGVLTAEEFEAEKAALLAERDRPAPPNG
jgi:ribosomal protein S27AE